jgi:hypothetical protein
MQREESCTPGKAWGWNRFPFRDLFYIIWKFWFVESLLLSMTFPSVLLFESRFQANMKNTYCLFQIKFITEYTNVQQVIITQILLKLFN